ncbi:MAG TPA: autotransporter-associated beta strand repeat-containing protein, partial [Phycisphaerae bacterium]
MRRLIARQIRIFPALRLAVALTGAGAGVLPVSAGDVRIKTAPASNDLSIGTNWIGSNAPLSGDRAVFDGPLTTTEFVLDNDASWQGIQLLSPGAALTLDAGNLLTLGSSGIDMSAATQSLILNAGVALACDASFNVATTLTLGGTMSLGTHTLTIAGSGVTFITGTPGPLLNGTLAADPLGRLVKSGAGTLTLNADTSLQAITLQAGRLNFVGKNLSQGVITLSGGILDYSTALNFPEAINVAGTATLMHTGQSIISETGNWTGAGAITWLTTLQENEAGQFSSFTGSLLFGASSGSLRLTGSTDHDLSNVNVDLGTATFTWLTNNGGNQSIGALSGGAGTVLRGASTSGTGAYIIGAMNISTTFAGAILNGTGTNATLGLTKVGTGTLTLTSTASAYSGALAIAAGVLATNQTASLGAASSAITLGNNAAGTAGTFRWIGGTLTTSRLLAIETTGT